MWYFPRLTRIEWLVVFALIVSYLALTLTHLTRLPIFVDEALYLRWSQIAWHDASWRFISLTDGKQPLYIWFVIPFMKLIADPLAAGRTASVFAGLGTVLGMGYLGWLLQGKKLGFFAMLLTIFSPYLFFYYRFGVMESLLTASGVWVCCLSVLLARHRRLDLALILGMATGCALLVKSSALFFLLLIPAAYTLVATPKAFVSHTTLRYCLLVLVSWLLAGVIYNIQRLSPWMHMIGEKNSFFTVSYSQIFAEPERLLNNFLDIWRWQGAYTTWPVVLGAFLGFALLVRRTPRQALVLLAWFLVPVVGTVAIAKLFAPRYIVFVTPFLLLSASYLVSTLPLRRGLLLLLFLLILPSYLITRLLTDPIHFPYTSVDEGYVNGWSAGAGTKQVADWAIDRVAKVGKVTIFTEGTFGILPHGLELYTDGKATGLTITGLYPIDQVPPERVLKEARTNPETYLLMNNTPVRDPLPATLRLVSQYNKRDPSYSMRLYQVVAPTP